MKQKQSQKWRIPPIGNEFRLPTKNQAKKQGVTTTTFVENLLQKSIEKSFKQKVAA